MLGDIRTPVQISSIRIQGRLIDSDELFFMLPGLFAGSWMWEKVLPRICDLPVSVVAMDTSLAESDIRQPLISEAVRIAEELLGLWPQKRITILANSMGGIIATELGIKLPNVSRIVLSGCPGLSGIANIGLRRTRDANEDEAYEAARMIGKRIYHDASRIEDAAVEKCAKLFLDRKNTSSIMRWLLSTREYAIDKRLCLYGGSLYCIWGAEDSITPVAPWEKLVPTLPNAELIKVPGCGHSPMFECPEEFYHAMEQCILRQEACPLRPSA